MNVFHNWHESLETVLIIIYGIHKILFCLDQNGWIPFPSESFLQEFLGNTKNLDNALAFLDYIME